MNAYKVTVSRVGTKVGAEDDAARLGIVLPNLGGFYSASFEGTIIHFEDGFGYVVKTDLSIVKAKLGELTMITNADFS